MGGRRPGRAETVASHRRQHCSDDTRALTPAPGGRGGGELRPTMASASLFQALGPSQTLLAVRVLILSGRRAGPPSQAGAPGDSLSPGRGPGSRGARSVCVPLSLSTTDRS